MPADFAHRQIRLTTMINELRAASSHCAIEHRAPIQANRVGPSCLPRQEVPYGATHHFLLADPFAGVLDNPFPPRDLFFCEHTKPFDPRTADAQLKKGEFRVEARSAVLSGHTGETE